MNNLTLLLFVFTSTLFFAQEKVTLENIASFEGKTITLCETVTGTHQTKSESKVTYLNFGKPFPDHAFTVVVFKNVLNEFSYDPLTLKNKKICVTGKVVFYKGKPQIVIKNESQIEVQQ